jgi:hypothetical protein
MNNYTFDELIVFYDEQIQDYQTYALNMTTDEEGELRAYKAIGKFKAIKEELYRLKDLCD